MMSGDMSGASAYLAEFGRLLDRIEVTAEGERLSVEKGIAAVTDAVVSLKQTGGKAILIGNGGSAAIVSHVHNDLCKCVGVRAIVFNETPLLTAVANDNGYAAVFHTQIDLWADRHDLLLAVSSSGESENIVNAAALGRERGCTVIAFTGFKPTNRLRQLAHLSVYVPASRYGYVEMAHSVIAHCVTDMASARVSAPVEIET